MKLKRQAGYIDIDFTGMIVGLLIVGALLGAFLGFIVPHLWVYAKHAIHVITG